MKIDSKDAFGLEGRLLIEVLNLSNFGIQETFATS